MPSLESNQLLRAAVDACDSKKAEDITILALDPSESSLTDYFLICSGTNERQNAAIADEIEFRLKNDFGVYPNSVEGRRQGEWVLMDYVDFVVHIFMPEKRAYYGLERLRRSAKTMTMDDLNDEIKAALSKTRAKSAKKAAKPEPVDDYAEASSGSASGKRPAAKPIATKAAETKTVATKTAAKKTVARKAVARKAVAKKAAPAKAAKAVVKKAVTKAAAKPAKTAAPKKAVAVKKAVAAKKAATPKKTAKKTAKK
ncbi:iojap-like ribosome-associated protein [Terriglobus roseus DSM 18391]|uniref:Ribosomal silencing factor RsfS n=1 Tax=Terriglobus roseus (strain DSM 18391 / NRRL B-41598 / KBS 63) TaxID=926566 RepID=I3ZBA9_TERRK|nr:ribosome silencing factor [Terriglobus roseus]AFL86527.1 iojap-like ribosome-associated protein [Terriglobus roseus DSM 18391]